MNNPNMILNQLMKSTGNSNPLAKNAIDMYQRHDYQGLQSMANNLCKAKGVNPEQMKQQIMNAFRQRPI